MNRNMKVWIEKIIGSPDKKAMPILSFPGIQIQGITVEQLVQSSEALAQCMCRIARQFDMGIAVTPMDLSVEAEAFGSKVRFSAGEVPSVCETLIQDEMQAQTLQVPEVGSGRTGICVDSVRKACAEITDRPVFAGMIGPYSLAGRLLDMTEIMILCYESPEMVETVLEKTEQFLIEYGKAFKKAGADGIVLAEPAAGLLSPPLIRQFSNPYVQRIIGALQDEQFMVIYHNCGNVIPLLDDIKTLDAAGFSFGNAVDLEETLKVIPENRLVLGNIDPSGIISRGNSQQVYDAVRTLTKRCGKYPNFVLSSGCDIPWQTPFENLEAFFKAADEK